MLLFELFTVRAENKRRIIMGVMKCMGQRNLSTLKDKQLSRGIDTIKHT